MKYFYALFLLVLFFPFSTLGQTNFQPGYVVTLAGDTLKGVIDTREWENNPQSIIFKGAVTDATDQEFDPSTVRHFAIPGQAVYQAFSGRISMDPYYFRTLLTQPDTSKTSVNVFLKVIRSGKNISLLSYQDNIKARFFLQEQQGLPQELGYRAFLNPQQNGVLTYKFYIGQLRLAAEKYGAASPDLQKQLSTAVYQESDLTAIVDRINGLDDQQVAAIKSSRSKKTRFLAGIGLNRTVFTVSGSHPLSEGTQYGASHYPKVSVGLDYFINPKVQRLFFRQQLTFTGAASSLHKKEIGEVWVREDHLTVKQKTLGVVSQGIFNIYNGSKLQLNVGVGVSFNLSAYSNESYRYKTYAQSDGRLASGNNNDRQFSFQPVWVSLPIRSGLILNRQWDVSVLYFVPFPVNSFDGST
jgi:hypothetical protein